MTGILYTYFKFGLSNINKAPRYRNSPLKRFDICIDLLVPIEKLSRFFHPLSQRGATFRGEGGSLETQYIGEKKKSRNKRHIIRIYDKKKDIIAKGKDSLYHDYLLHQDITRIELEVRRELAQTYTFEELVVPENLFGLLKNYLKRHTHIFDLLDVTELSLYRKPEIIPFRLIQANEEGRKRVTMYLGHARGLLER